MTPKNIGSEVNIIVSQMIQNINICLILVTTGLILSRGIVTDLVPLFSISFVKDLSLNVLKPPYSGWQMRYGIPFVGYSWLQGVWIDLLEPIREGLVSNPWRPIVLKETDLISRLNQVCDTMGGDRCA